MIDVHDLKPPEGELAQDGDRFEVELDDDSTLTYHLKVEDDDLSAEDIEDPEVFGRYEFARRSNYAGRSDRPDGFDGAARKLHLGNNQPMHEDLWFQPPEDLKNDPERLELHIRHVREILMWGYSIIGVSLTHETAAGYRRTWRSHVGGCEPFPDREYLQETADDLARDVTSQFVADTQPKERA